VKTRVAWLAVAAVVSAVLVMTYAAAGGTDYAPAAGRDPCEPRKWPDVSGTTEIGEQLALSAIDGAACKLGVSGEELALAFTSQKRLDQFAKERGISEGEIQDAARDGLIRAIGEGEKAGEINGIEAFVLRLAARAAPIDRLIEYVRGSFG
jgi:hypothetical protein